jgi:hypothetical protein
VNCAQVHVLHSECWVCHPCSAAVQAKASAAAEKKKLSDELRLERAGRERAEELLVRQVGRCTLTRLPANSMRCSALSGATWDTAAVQRTCMRCAAPPAVATNAGKIQCAVCCSSSAAESNALSVSRLPALAQPVIHVLVCTIAPPSLHPWVLQRSCGMCGSLACRSAYFSCLKIRP